jgi:hypothetical protein
MSNLIALVLYVRSPMEMILIAAAEMAIPTFMRRFMLRAWWGPIGSDADGSVNVFVLPSDPYLPITL